MWVPRIAGSAGSALLGTPMTTSGTGPGDLSSRRNQTRLETQVVLLPTPRASENENRQTKRTPSQMAGTHGKNLAAEVCELLPTPRASDTGTPGRRASEGFRPPLSQVILFPTPRASDGAKGGPNQRGSSGDLTLPSAAVRLLPTPTTQAHARNKTANRTDPKVSTNTESSTLLDVFWTGEPTEPPSNGGST
jgi:hypothetical protein